MKTATKKAIIEAIRKSTGDDLSRVQELVEGEKALPKGRARDEIMIAAVDTGKQNGVLDYLLEKGIDPGKVALEHALKIENIATAKKLLAHDAVAITNAAIAAIKRDDIELLDTVLSRYKGVIYKPRGRHLMEKLVPIAASNCSLDMVQHLFEQYDIPLSSKSITAHHALAHALEGKKQSTADWLMEHDVPVLKIHGSEAPGDHDVIESALAIGDNEFYKKVEAYFKERESKRPAWKDDITGSDNEHVEYKNREIQKQRQKRLAAAIKGGSAELIDHCVAHGADLNQSIGTFYYRDKDRDPLFYAGGNLPLLKHLMEEKGAMGRSGVTPIYGAVAAGNIPAIEYLREKGFRIDNAGLAYACALKIEDETTRRQTLQYLMDQELSANEPDRFYPLEVAVQNGLMEEAKMLIAYGAKAELGKSVLRVPTGNDQLMQLLLDSGADVWAGKGTSRQYAGTIEHALNQPEKIAPTTKQIVLDKMINDLATNEGVSHGLRKKITHLRPNTTEYEAFTKLLITALNLDLTLKRVEGNSGFPKPLPSLINTPDSFEKLWKKTPAHGENQLEDMKDMTREFATHVLLPAAVLLIGKEQDENVLNNRGIIHDEQMIQYAELAAEGLFEGKTLDKALLLSREWHDPQNQFPDELRPYSAYGQWHKLTEDYTFPEGHPLAGYQVVFLDSMDALKDEGERMHHCVGSYGTRCLSGDSFIWSIRNPQGKSISTFEMGKAYGESGDKIDFKTSGGYKRTLALHQHRGIGNGNPSEEAQQVFRAYKQVAEHQALITGHETGATDETKEKTFVSAISQQVGYDITWENVEKAFEHYKNFRQDRRNYLVAGAAAEKDADGKGTGNATPRREMHIQQWLKETGLDQKLVKALHSVFAAQMAARLKKECDLGGDEELPGEMIAVVNQIVRSQYPPNPEIER